MCNGEDDDCDGNIDDGKAEGCLTWYLDVDGDEAGDAAYSTCACAADGPFTAAVAGGVCALRQDDEDRVALGAALLERLGVICCGSPTRSKGPRQPGQ